MGKAADNEKARLKATLRNNVAIALFATAAFLPLFALARAVEWLFHAQNVYRAEAVIVLTGVAAVAAVFFAALSHRAALKELDKIED